MEFVDNREFGRGLTVKQLRDFLNSVPDHCLSKHILLRGVHCGHDYVSFIGQTDEEFCVIEKGMRLRLLNEGDVFLLLQNGDITHCDCCKNEENKNENVTVN